MSAGLALSLGCEGGLLFTVAHELLHSVRPLDKALSKILLCSVGYMHWTCSHLAHHRNVRPSCSFWGVQLSFSVGKHTLQDCLIELDLLSLVKTCCCTQ